MRNRGILERASHQQGEQTKEGNIIWSYAARKQEREKQTSYFFPTAQKREPIDSEDEMGASESSWLAGVVLKLFRTPRGA